MCEGTTVSTSILRGIVQGGKVVLLGDSSPLVDGTEVVVTPLRDQPGTATGVLAAMSGSPHVPIAWVDELDALIESGQHLADGKDPFSEA